VVLALSRALVAAALMNPAITTVDHAVVQLALYLVAGFLVLWLTYALTATRQKMEAANRELRAANEETSRSEEQLRRLIERMPDGVGVYEPDPVDRLAYANSAFADRLGYGESRELVGVGLKSLISPESLPLVQSRVGRMIDTGQLAPAREVIMLRRDGSPCTVETAAIPFQYQGRPAILVVMRDLTERKRADEALRLSEAKFSGIVSISADAIISVDEQRQITIFNRGAEAIFGYSAAEAIGKPLDLLLPERFVDAHRRQVEAFAGGASGVRRMGVPLTKVRGRRKNGEEFPAEASISKLTVGESVLLTVVLRDVSERERFEREQRFLTDVGVAVATSLDYDQTLATIAQLVVRDLADWCVVEVRDPSNGMRRAEVACSDARLAPVAERLKHFPVDRSRRYLMSEVVESLKPLLVERFTDAQL
jgi:PAS domain S-box-containing protein